MLLINACRYASTYVCMYVLFVYACVHALVQMHNNFSVCVCVCVNECFSLSLYGGEVANSATHTYIHAYAQSVCIDIPVPVFYESIRKNSLHVCACVCVFKL